MQIIMAQAQMPELIAKLSFPIKLRIKGNKDINKPISTEYFKSPVHRE